MLAVGRCHERHLITRQVYKQRRSATLAEWRVRHCHVNVFASFAQTGSARRVWLWFRSEGLTFPLQMHQGAEIRWVEASYTAIHHVLTNPVYAGAYAYGKSRRETMLNASGVRGCECRR